MLVVAVGVCWLLQAASIRYVEVGGRSASGGIGWRRGVRTFPGHEVIIMHTTATLRHQRRLDTVEGYLLLRMSQQALREVDAVRAGGLNNADVCQLRGEALRDLARHDEALEEFERADELQPDDLTTLMGMAWCLKRIDRLDDAIETMQRAYQSHPDEPIVLYNIACYYSLAGDKSQALSWLGRALRMQPKLRRLIPDESDFDPLRSDPDFQFISTDPRDAVEER